MSYTISLVWNSCSRIDKVTKLLPTLGRFVAFLHTRSAIEHTNHICDLRHIPLTNILIKGSGTIEHSIHTGDLGHIPMSYSLVEGSSTTEHSTHICDLRHIPLTNSLIKCSSTLEHKVRVTM